MKTRLGSVKRLLLFLLLAVMTFPVAAAPVFSAIRQNVGTGVSMSATGELFLRSLQGGTVPTGVVSMGYYVLDANYNPIAGLGGTIDLSQLASGNAVSLGTFTQGQQVAFWMKTENGATLDSIYDGEKGNDRNAAYVENNGSGNLQMVLGYGGYGGGYSPVKPGQLDSASDLYFEISGKAQQDIPAQGSLPGMLAFLVLGLAVLFGWRLWARARARTRSAA